MTRQHLKDEILIEDSHSVLKGHWYLVDNNPIQSKIDGTVDDLKEYTGGKVIRRFDMLSRALLFSFQDHSVDCTPD